LDLASRINDRPDGPSTPLRDEATRFALRYRWLVICLAMLFTWNAVAQEGVPRSASSRRPRIGLALAGGGARGGAHIGVLKVLEELRIPIDCIAGTSMGAVVGGGYSSGMPASEIEEFVRHVDWKSVLGGVGSRQLEPVEQRRFNDASGSIELGFKGGRIVPPSGLIATSRIEDVLRSYVAKARAVEDFNKLPIPYRAVATDMLTGNMVVLDHGDIAAAMRASMAVPGAFAPVVTDQYVLADGFVVRNLPIDVVRNTCADVVIAVNLVKPPVTRQDLSGPVSLISRSNDVMSEANEREQLQTLTDRDVRVDVDMGEISTSDFQRMPETIERGEKGARKVSALLAKLSVSESEYAAWRHRVTVPQGVPAKIAAVEFKGLKHVDPEYLRTLTSVHAGDAVDIAAISRDAARMAALDDLEGVEYHLTQDAANPVLVWEPREKAMGPDYVRPSAGMYVAGEGQLRVEVELQYIRRWLNSFGGQWRNRATIGTSTFAGSSLYQPVDIEQKFFVEPSAQVGRSLEDIYDHYQRVAQYFFTDLGGGLDAGVNVAPNSQFRIGYRVDRRHVEVNTGGEQLPTGDFTDAGFTLSALYDSRDASSFASSGTAAELQYFWAGSALGGDRDWQILEGAVRRVVWAGAKTTLQLTAAGGTDLGTSLPGDRAFSLGGPQSFPGYAPGEVRARGYFTLQGDMRWRVADILAIANQALYGGVELQAARVFGRVDPVPSGALYGISGYVGGRTPLGTLTLGVGKTTGSWAGWVTLGTAVGSGSILDHPAFR
jgi:NTE family protein